LVDRLRECRKKKKGRKKMEKKKRGDVGNFV
jgi:hypothetical protein